MHKLVRWTLLTLSIALCACTISRPVLGQPKSIDNAAQTHPLSVPHLYWHFLVYQNVLDSKAAAAQAEGRDGAWFRTHLQQYAGLSDSDFAYIRIASLRLTGRIKLLNTEAARLKSLGQSPQLTQQLNQLRTEQEAAIDSEVVFLRHSLSPKVTAQFERFLKQFFHQPNATGGVLDSTSGVQQ